MEDLHKANVIKAADAGRVFAALCGKPIQFLFIFVVLAQVLRFFYEERRNHREEKDEPDAKVQQHKVVEDGADEVGQHAKRTRHGLHPGVPFGTLAALGRHISND